MQVHVTETRRGRKKCFKLAQHKKVFPHNVLIFDEEHRLYLGNVVETAVDVSNKNHSAFFPIELPSWFIRNYKNAKIKSSINK